MIKKLFYKILHKIGLRWCESCGKFIGFSKQTLMWAGGVDYNEDGSSYLAGYTAPACENCIGFAEKHQFDYC